MRALRTPLTMAVLSLLREQPRHPYEMQALVRERHIGEVVKLRGGSLYDAIRRLERAGLVQPVETTRAGTRPERTVYAITDSGRETLRSLVREYVGTPAEEYPTFTAGLAHLLNLDRDEVALLLQSRIDALQAELDDTDRHLTPLQRAGVPRIVLLEVEYTQTLRRTEIEWLRQVVRAIEAGALPWPTEEADSTATRRVP
ncbi:PadR family transcriptional regulator [Actinopolymorpha alba]|uniref:PadR family transcriptional regulator n=1 Tax=Actinopolymorpha alba TaxID=533267 RepID=UPI00035F682C|nr:PadR family transcriptional regulator [Actinopolymorpha alba]